MVFNQEFKTQLSCLSMLTLKYVLFKKKKKVCRVFWQGKLEIPVGFKR